MAVVVVRMRMEAAVYEDIVGSLRARAWGDLDTMQEEMGREFPAVAAQSIRSILYQARRWRCFYLHLLLLSSFVRSSNVT